MQARVRIDLMAECIWRDGERLGVRPKAFLVLRCLLDRPGELLTKEELLGAVWPETHVVDKVLNIAVSELRQALGDDQKQPRFIETVHRRGFRWIGPASSIASAAGEDSDTFVGRADALAELERRYELAKAGERQTVFVTGEAGIGKSRLIDRFLDRVRDDASTGVVVARGQCLDRYGVGESYRPILDAIESVVEAGDVLRSTFRKHAPTWLLRLHDVLGEDEVHELRRLVPDENVDRMQRELERALEAASAAQVLVLALEDLHWSDVPTVAMLGQLAAGRKPARLLVLGSFRPTDAIAQTHPVITMKRELASKRQCTEVALSGLTSEAVGSLLEQRFGRHALPEALASQLQTQTSGNPLFLVNALADLVQRGWLREEDGAWHCNADLAAIAEAVPDGTRELIALRLDALPPSTQELLEAASVAGMSFATQLVAAALERGHGEVEDECRRLTHTLFLQQGEDVEWLDGTRGREHRFGHALYRQVLEARIPPSHRQLLHRRIAERLERAYVGRTAEIAATLRHHFERAGETLRAVDLLEVQLQESFARRAVRDALDLQEEAVRLLERLPGSEEAQRRLRHKKIELGFLSTTTVGSSDARTARAIAQIEQDKANSSPGGGPPSSEHVLSLAMAATGHLAGGKYLRCREAAEEILSAGGRENSEVVLTGLAFAGMSSFYLGDIRRSLTELDEVFRIAPAVPAMRLGDGPVVSIYDTAVPALGLRAQALALAGRSDRSEESLDAALARARTIEMPWYQGWALSAACSTNVLRRDFAGVRRRAAELEHHCGEGQEHLRAVARFLSTWAELMESGNPALASRLPEMLDEVMSVPDPMISTRYLSMLGEAFLHLGQTAPAAAALERAAGERGECRFYDAELSRQRAALVRCRAGRGRLSEAMRKQMERELESAIATAKDQCALLFELHATVDLARLLLEAGRNSEARRDLAAALSAFDEGCEDTDVREARETMDSIGD